MAAFVNQIPDRAGWSGFSGDVKAARALPPRPAQTGHNVPAMASLSRSRRTLLLDRLVATEILPRLVLARRAATSRDAAISETEVAAGADSSELVGLVLTEEAVAAVAFVESLLRHGTTFDFLYLRVLPEAARLLGRLWDEDRCDFGQVTISMGRLQQVARAVAPGFQAAAVVRPGAHSVLLLPAPGEQHTFGLSILGEYFRHASWRVAGGPVLPGADVADLLRRTWFDIVGFSIGSEAHLAGLTKRIHQIRRASRNRRLGVMVGGPLFARQPDLVAYVGADTGAADAPTAIQQAQELLSVCAASD